MTEQELNLKVSNVIFHGWDAGDYFDWCVRAGDWGELAGKNKIDIAHQENGMVFAGAGKCGDDFYAYEATDEEIGVAVVKCFLMMNGVEL